MNVDFRGLAGKQILRNRVAFPLFHSVLIAHALEIDL